MRGVFQEREKHTLGHKISSGCCCLYFTPVGEIYSKFIAHAAHHFTSDVLRSTHDEKEGLMRETISVKGARENNLQNVGIEIPRDKLVVVTGISGSGKSSLAFETVYAKGQRRFLESMPMFNVG